MSLSRPPSTLKADRPRIGLVVVDDGLYTHRWVASVLDHGSIRPVCVACLSPFQAVNLNPGCARGLWAVARARLGLLWPARHVAIRLQGGRGGDRRAAVSAGARWPAGQRGLAGPRPGHRSAATGP